MSSMIGATGYGPTGSLAVNMPYATGKTSMQKMGGYRHFKTPSFTPEQFQLFQRMFGQLGPDSFLSKLAGGDPEMFEQMEAPALRQFSSILGGIGSRYSAGGLGERPMSSRRSSGFQLETGQTAKDFAQQLQSQRLGLQRQAVGDLMSYSNQLLNQRPFEHTIAEKKPSFLQSLAPGGLESIGKIIAAMMA